MVCLKKGFKSSSDLVEPANLGVTRQQEVRGHLGRRNMLKALQYKEGLSWGAHRLETGTRVCTLFRCTHMQPNITDGRQLKKPLVG